MQGELEPEVGKRSTAVVDVVDERVAALGAIVFGRVAAVILVVGVAVCVLVQSKHGAVHAIRQQQLVAFGLVCVHDKLGFPYVICEPRASAAAAR